MAHAQKVNECVMMVLMSGDSASKKWNRKCCFEKEMYTNYHGMLHS